VRTFCDVCDFSVIDETDDWMVVNKPAPLQVHPSKPDGGPTLWHGLRELLRYELENGAALSLINRLDRDTSGIVLVAKNKATARTLHKAMMRREVEKEYRAIVWGWPEWDTLEVREPILRRGSVEESDIYAMQRIHPDGAASHTSLRVLQRFERTTTNGSRFSLLGAVPHTGRMHQIRIHAAHAGCPVIGDKLYGPSCEWYLRQIRDGWTPEAAAALLLPRHALHSCLMGITTEDGAHHVWRAPLPADMQAFLEKAAAQPCA
jgi:23S rRNA pseudouridine1911/1915/1917 synthase